MNTLPKIRWGIVGTGGIARKFIQDLAHANQASLHAVASRSLATAQQTAQEFGIPTAYGSYSELFADPQIDIVYMATPNHRHCADTLEALEAGKHVLCEKPFALDPEQARAMVAKAQSKNLFLMEALWTRFVPSIQALITLLQDGAIGDPRLLRADFGFQARFNAHSRLFDPALGGGSVYDIGIYPLFLAQLLFGNPESLHAQATFAPTGVDTTTTMILGHAEGRQSQLTSSFELDLETEAHVYGTQGKLVLHRRFHMPTALTLHNDTGVHPIELPPTPGTGYQYQANAAMDCFRRGLIECPEWNHQQTLQLVELIAGVYQKIKG